MEFEWDETKNRINQIKHGVSLLSHQERQLQLRKQAMKGV